jgi:hypothetical protein
MSVLQFVSIPYARWRLGLIILAWTVTLSSSATDPGFSADIKL